MTKNTILTIFTASVLFCACSSNKQNEAAVDDSPKTQQEMAKAKHDARIDESMEKSKGDTLMVYEKAKEVLDQLKAGNVEGALDQIYEYSLQEIIPLTPERRKALKSTFSAFPVLRYSIDSLELLSNEDNELHYTIYFSDDYVDSANKFPGLKLVMCPVRYNGQWYMTIPKEVEDPFYSEKEIEEEKDNSLE